MTYRYGPHATADDPTRYRSREEEEKWKQRDPIERLRRFLESRGEWDERVGEKVTQETADQVEAAITAIEAEPLPGRDDAVRHGFHRIPAHVVDQLHAMQRAHGEARDLVRRRRGLEDRARCARQRAHRVLDHGRRHQRRPRPGDGA